MLARILPFSGTHTDFTIFRNSSGEFFNSGTESTFSRYSPGFYHFSVLLQIRPFFGTRREGFLTLARILPFPGTRPDSNVFGYSHRFDPFPVLMGTVFGYSHGFYLFSVHAPILSFFGTPTDSTLFRYSWEQLLLTRTDSTFSRYSPGFFHFSVLPQIRPFFGTCGGNFWLPARILAFPGTRPDSTIFGYSH